MAALDGRKDMAALLLERGADIEAKDNVSGPRIRVVRGWMGRGECGVTQVWGRVRPHECGAGGFRPHK